MTTDTDTLRELLATATPGVWKLWGMQVMADQDGTSNVDTAVPVAQTYFRDEHDKPKTWDGALIVAAVNALPDLLDERDRMLATIARVEALADEWAEEGADLIRNCYSGQDVFEGEQMERCATDLRAALAGEGA